MEPLFRGHSQSCGKCPWIEVGLEFVNNEPTKKISLFFHSALESAAVFILNSWIMYKKSWLPAVCWFPTSRPLKSEKGHTTLKLQWNPVDTVTNKPKNLAVLTGWPYYWGRIKFHDLRAVMTNTLCIAFAELFSLINNQNVDMEYSNWKNYLKFSFSAWNSFKIRL